MCAFNFLFFSIHENENLRFDRIVFEKTKNYGSNVPTTDFFWTFSGKRKKILGKYASTQAKRRSFKNKVQPGFETQILEYKSDGVISRPIVSDSKKKLDANV